MSVVIQIDKLGKVFSNNAVLDGVSLQIPTGAVVGLLGTNGSGKSTLIKCLLGLLRPTFGSASIFGEDVWNLSADAKSQIGYVPQEVKLYPWMTVQQVIEYTSAFYAKWNCSWVDELIDRWRIDTSSVVLSAGENQRLALILAMGHRPELMILDEPVASLDPVGRREFLRSLLELTTGQPRTVLFSTHITSDLERVASHVAILQDGRITRFTELDTLKDQFKRIRIRSAEELPSSFHVRGALRTRVEGANALVSIPDVDDDLL